MASGKIRSTRRLRAWMVEQVNSGKYPGLIWDNTEKTMFRIPWKHAGKQDFRSEEDAAIFKAWAEFKGKLSEDGRSDPASWKTRLRCALNKSPEFSEVTERSQLDISEPYKVYRLVPMAEQGVAEMKRQGRERTVKNKKRMKRYSSESESEEDVPAKQIKEEITAVQPITMSVQEVDTNTANEISLHPEELTDSIVTLKSDGVINEIQLNFTIETIPPSAATRELHSFLVTVHYVGQEVLRREIVGSDFRIAFQPCSPLPPSPPSLNGTVFHRIPLPEPPAEMTSNPDLGPRLQAISTLLPFMEKGVALTSTGSGIYAKRFCQGRVFWRGPHTTKAGPHKLERAGEPTMLFNRETFKQELESFRTTGIAPPQSSFTMCFGEELHDTDDPSDKHIIIKISLPWAEKQTEDAQVFRNSINLLHNLASSSPNGEVTLNLVPVP
ncbi:interferon regulatory factor 9 [Chanos chanos]|uniref:Interferon regulatory factor 9 n=1 Tax=Chanos chanos TaxID=29144 RepID=A0A6J2VDA6_CHACN|nr:interferon regulatory factor 9-like [Chanos chanos]